VLADGFVKGAGLYKAVIVWPYAVAPAIAGVLWWFLFNPTIGVLPRLLEPLGIVWNHFLNGHQALLLIIIASAWKQVSYNFLFFLAGLQTIPKSLLEAAGLGQILSASASIRWWRDEAYFAQQGRGTLARDGGGVLLTQAIHTLDLLLHLVGPHKDVAGFAYTSPLRAIDTEDVTAAAIRFHNGAIGVLDATSVARPGYPERIEIAGTRGSAVLETLQLTINRAEGAPEIIGSVQSGGGGADPMAFDHSPHRAVITEMLDAIEQRREPSNHVRSALHVQRLIEALLADAAARG